MGILVGAGVAVALAAAGAFAERSVRERELADLRVRLSAVKVRTAAASLVVERVAGTESWRAGRPSFLECLRDVTLAFPPDGRIWATSVAVREDMRGVISGKAADAGAVVALLDDLRRNAAFRDVKLVHMREAGGESRQIAYAVSLVFVRRTGAAADDGKAR